MTETVFSKRRGPCKDCPDRYFACSDHCRKPDFLAWKQEQNTIRENKRNYRSPAWASEEPYQKRSDPTKRSRR